MTRRVVVVGGGITGLATGWLLQADHACDVTVLEASDRPGGMVRTEPFAGVDLDMGPDSMLARQPDGPDLARRVGLGDDLVAPATGGVRLWVRGRLRPLPAATVLGVPTDPVALARAGVLSPAALARACVEPLLPGRALRGDATVAVAVGRRFGTAVVDTLVEPLLAGIYAGRADELSLDATAAPVAAAARRGRSLQHGLRAHRRAGLGKDAEPVFATVRGGLSRLVGRLVDDLGDRVALASPATHLEPGDGDRWQVVTPGGVLGADAVVLATPAPVTARLVAGVAPGASRALAGIGYASVGVVALGYPASTARGLPHGSGMLVPRAAGTLVKAATWVSQKWAHQAGNGTVLVRASVGRVDDRRALDLDDEALVAAVRSEIAAATGLAAELSAARVRRWEDALPQYRVGHRDRVRLARAALDAAGPGLHAGGAAFDGVGVSACIRQAGDLAARAATA